MQENYNAENIFVTGNTVIDALLAVREKIHTDMDLQATLESQFPMLDASKKLILVTGHRRESFGGGFEHLPGTAGSQFHRAASQPDKDGNRCCRCSYCNVYPADGNLCCSTDP